MVSSLEIALLAALLSIAVLLVIALFIAHWWHGLRDARGARLRDALRPMALRWAERGAEATELAWLERLPPADGRTALVTLLNELAQLGPEGAAHVREGLRRSGLAARELARLRHRSATRRIEACRLVGRLGDPGAVPSLLERLRDPDPGVRREAVRALGELQAVDAIPDLAQAIEALGEWSNLLLVMALVRMGPGGVPAVGALLATSRSPGMTKALLQVTGRLGRAADPGMIRTLASHPDSEVRVEAVRALGLVAPDAESAAVCLAAMDDPEWPVRALAASSLGRLRDARAIPRLARAMGDPAYWVRHHAAEAMAELGEPGAAALRRALDDINPFVRDMASQTLFMRGLARGEAA